MARIIQTGDLTPDTRLSQMDREWVYNGLDSCVTLEVLNELKTQLDNVTAQTYQFSLALQAPILDMTMRGVLVDEYARQKALEHFRKEIKKLEAGLDYIIKEGVGIDINWRSPQQLIKLLYTVMRIPPVRKRNSQGRMAPTVNREALEKLTQYFYAEPICNYILKMRELDKKRMFLESEIDSDQRMRCNYNIAGTTTGRLSSSVSEFGTGNNMQNIDTKLRAVFIADPGMKFANLDLEQADARNVGAVCWNLFVEEHGEKFAGAYLDACESGDLHTTVCSMAWTNLKWPDGAKARREVADQIAYRQLSYRDLAKKLGHGTNYYGQPPTMAKHTKVPAVQIAAFQHSYFRGFPCIPEWHQYVRNSLRDTGTITTLLGRRRRFFGRFNDDATLREAIAYEPQSLTADEIDLGILKLWRADKSILLIQVHDSILIQYPEEQEDEIVPWALETLRVTIPLARGREFSVPTEAKVGWNWGNVEYDKQGNVKTNPDGLVKWTGHDSRKRSYQPSMREIFDAET